MLDVTERLSLTGLKPSVYDVKLVDTKGRTCIKHGGCGAQQVTVLRPQRVRDPLHNLIEFGAAADNDQRELEQVLWQVVQTRPFQRLRRIKQLGFSELVFPGATHTRFAHSLGVFHTARQLVGSIQRSLGLTGGFKASQAKIAIAAALLHDVGHGMFSHAFEAVGRELRLPLARHETMSDRIIRGSDITPY